MKIAVSGSSGLIGARWSRRCALTATRCSGWSGAHRAPRTSAAGTRSTAGSTRRCSTTSTRWSTSPASPIGRGRGPRLKQRMLASRVDVRRRSARRWPQRRPPTRPAARAAVGLRGRLLRRHRRPRSSRGATRRATDFLAQVCVAVGGGDRARRGGRGSGWSTCAPDWCSRTAPADAGAGPAVPARAGRPAGQRAAVLAVDQPAPTRSTPSGTC